MKTALCFLGLTALAVASVLPTVQKKVADEELIKKQIQIIRLIVNVNQPYVFDHIRDIVKDFEIQSNLDKYTNVEAVKHFVTLYKRGLMPMNEVFSVFYEQQREEAISLFEVLFYAKDFDTFYKTAAWARIHVNPGQFYYAFSVAFLHRQDTHGLSLPAPYEMYPQLFVDTEVTQKALETRMLTPKADYNKVFVIPVNKTGWYPYYQYQDNEKHWEYQRNIYGYDSLEHTTPEDRLSYFTEDIGLNTYYNYLHLGSPFWMNATYGFKTERRGELFYYTNEQLLARYILERFSNDLHDIDVLNYEVPIEAGYNPHLRYPNGEDFPVRPDHYDVSHFNNYELQLIQDFERRIRDAIDVGFVFTKDLERFPLTDPKGIDVLGQMIEATADSVNYNYYGRLFQLSLQLLGHIVDHTHTSHVAPGVLEQYETVLRDPLYYRFLAGVSRIFLRYKSMLPHYHREDLFFPGVKIETLDVEKLITYFEPFEFDVSTLAMSAVKEDQMTIKARQYRLNNKPWTYKMNVKSDKVADSVVRVFLGPKYDAEGRVLSINEKRRLMVELDRFPYKLAAGDNIITRNSKDIISTRDDFPDFRTQYNKLKDALQGKGTWEYEELDRHCAFPNRLLLPKGKRGGMPFTFFVTITPTTETEVKYDSQYWGCGTGYGLFYQDQHAMGYPFDRVVEEQEFHVPNFYEKDVIIFHKRSDEIVNQSS